MKKETKKRMTPLRTLIFFILWQILLFFVITLIYLCYCEGNLISANLISANLISGICVIYMLIHCYIGLAIIYHNINWFPDWWSVVVIKGLPKCHSCGKRIWIRRWYYWPDSDHDYPCHARCYKKLEGRTKRG